MNNDIVYDLETFPNCFTATFMHSVTGYLWVFEISDRRNDIAGLVAFLEMCQANASIRFVGFNNLGFDYPIIHMIILSRGQGITAAVCHAKAQEIISSQAGFAKTIPPYEVKIPQIDLFKIHHFDNRAKSTSLKALQFNMRAQSVEDMPFAVNTVLAPEQMDTLLSYNFHDVAETLRFYWLSKGLIDFRESLSKKYNKNFLNHNDTKIGKDYFVMELEKLAPGSCYEPGTRQVRQTHRPYVDVKDVLLPFINFTDPEFNRILDWYRSLRVYEFDKPSASCIVGGFEFHFGLGGIHGSVSNRNIHSDHEYVVIDIDVAGYYPDVAIINSFAPAHLGQPFVVVYTDIKGQRKIHAKGTIENGVLKLANNGVFGDSGNPYSPFFDLQYLFSVTINGQLMLCMLAEQLIRIPSLEIIQANTDGMTFRVKREQLANVHVMTDWWQKLTGFTLEENVYKSMFIRDVNAYLAVKENGKVAKRKGPFSHIVGPNLGEGELAWHQDHSALVIAKAAEAYMLDDADISEFIYGHRDIFDFMLRAKVPRSSKLMWGDYQLPNITRFYISTDGQPLSKIMPPAEGCKVGEFKRANGLTDSFFRSVEREIGGSTVWDERIHTKNKSRYDNKKMGIEVGFLTSPANHISHARFENINYSYYIQAARALVDSVGLVAM